MTVKSRGHLPNFFEAYCSPEVKVNMYASLRSKIYSRLNIKSVKGSTCGSLMGKRFSLNEGIRCL